MAGTGVVTSAKSYEPPSSVTYGLRIYREGVADDSKFNLYLKDDSANGTRLLEIDHYGAGASQSFALDIHNYPGARSALVVHQYSALSERSNSTTPPIRRWPSCIIPRINALTGNQCRRLRLLPVGGIRESENIHRWRNDVWQSTLTSTSQASFASTDVGDWLAVHVSRTGRTFNPSKARRGRRCRRTRQQRTPLQL
jgi:hypothetical protein